MSEDPLEIALENYQIVKGRHGRFLVNICDYYMGQSMIRYGEYSPAEVKGMTTLLPKGGTVIEVGANMGLITVPLAQKAGPSGRVIAYEPVRCNYFALCASLALNNISNTTPERIAVGREPGRIRVPSVNQEMVRKWYESGEVVNLGSIILDKENKGASFDSVDLITLDSLKVDRIDLIKVDVEGMELDVLKGGEKNISIYKPFIFVENNEPEKSNELITFLNELGYKCFWHITPLYSPNNYKEDKDSIFGDVHAFNMICAPKEKINFIQGLSEARADDIHPLAHKKRIHADG